MLERTCCWADGPRFSGCSTRYSEDIICRELDVLVMSCRSTVGLIHALSWLPCTLKGTRVGHNAKLALQRQKPAHITRSTYSNQVQAQVIHRAKNVLEFGPIMHSSSLETPMAWVQARTQTVCQADLRAPIGGNLSTPELSGSTQTCGICWRITLHSRI